MLVLLSPLLLVLSPLMAVYALARLARRVSWWLFRDDLSARLNDPAVVRVKKIRMWAAVVVSVTLLSAFGSVSDVDELLSDRWVALLATPWLLIATSPVVVVILICCSPAERRPVMRSALRGPLGELAWYLGTVAFVVGLIAGVMVSSPTKAPGGLGPWLVVACVVAVVWAVLLFLFASARVAQTGFGLARVHPALPALLTSVLVWEYAVMNGLPSVPAPVAYAMFLGGPTSVTAIVWWEIRRLRTRYGVTLRGG